MAKISRKIPWTRQPQEPVEIDRSNPFASAFTSFLYPVSGKTFDACQNKLFGQPTDTSLGTYANGQNLEFNGTSSGVNFGDVESVNFTGAYSIFILFRPDAQGGTRREQLVSKDSATGRQFTVELNPRSESGSAAGQTASIGHARFVTNSTYYQGYTDANIVTNGKWHSLLIGSTNGSTDIVGYLDAAELTFTVLSAITGLAQNTTTDLYLGRRAYSGYEDYFDGGIAAIGIANTAPNKALAEALYRNPWQLLEPQTRNVWVPVTSSGVTGTISSTIDSFTSSLLGTTTIVGNINNNISSFTSSITGNSTIVGQIAYTNQDITSSITGTTAIIGQIAVTNQDSTSNITGDVGAGVTGTIESTLQDSTSSIQGTTQIGGTMSAIMDSFTSAMQGTTTILGTISKTMDDFISSISGFIGEAKARLLSLLGVGS